MSALPQTRQQGGTGSTEGSKYPNAPRPQAPAKHTRECGSPTTTAPTSAKPDPTAATTAVPAPSAPYPNQTLGSNWPTESEKTLSQSTVTSKPDSDTGDVAVKEKQRAVHAVGIPTQNNRLRPDRLSPAHRSGHLQMGRQLQAPRQRTTAPGPPRRLSDSRIVPTHSTSAPPDTPTTNKAPKPT